MPQVLSRRAWNSENTKAKWREGGLGGLGGGHGDDVLEWGLEACKGQGGQASAGGTGEAELGRGTSSAVG